MEDQAILTITFAGQQGDLPDFISPDATDEQIRSMATEAVRTGSVPGLAVPEDGAADFSGYVIDRFPPNEVRPHYLRTLRAKTPFGV